MIQQAISAVFEYGVWWAGFTYHRLPVLIAVDSFGDIRKWRAVKPLEDGEALGERMWTWLLKYHPERTLQLVPDAPATPALGAEPGRLVKFRGRMVDERLLSDPRSPLHVQWRRDQIIKSGAARSSIFTSRIGS